MELLSKKMDSLMSIFIYKENGFPIHLSEKIELLSKKMDSFLYII